MAFNSDDMMSSPDPLNDSGIFTSPDKTRRRTSSKPKARISLPMNSSSPNKQTFELAVGSGISPQKLFVTVEAANSDSEIRYTRSPRRELVFPSPYRTDSSPSRRHERTTTTTIPLRGLSDTEDADFDSPATTTTPKRGRGRPRKSGTPIPKKIDRRRRTTQNFDNDDIWDLGVLDGVAAGKGKGKSRSGSTTKKGPTKKAKANATDGNTPRKGRGRPKKLRQDVPAAIENNDEEIGMETLQDFMPNRSTALADNENIDMTSSNSDIPIEDRNAYSDHPDIPLAKFDDSMQIPRKKVWSSSRRGSSGEPEISKRTSFGENEYLNDDDNDDANLQRIDDEDLGGQMDETPATEYPRRSAGMGIRRSDSEDADAQKLEDGGETEDDNDEYQSEADEIVGELREFDTIMESEDFSMISVNSLREHISPPNDDQNPTQKSDPTSELSQPTRKSGGEDSFSTIAQSVLDAASPVKGQAPLQAFRGHHLTQKEDSFSSISQSILEAASPLKKGNPGKQYDLTPKAASRLSRSPGLSQLSEAEIIQSESQKNISGDVHMSQWPTENHETVEPQRQADGNIPATVDDTNMMSPVAVGSADNTPRPTSSRRSSHWSGLATPRESISPFHESIPEDSTRISLGISEGVDENEDQDTHMDSSPPPYVNSPPHEELPEEIPQEAPQEIPQRYTYTTHIRGQRVAHPDKIETPSIVFSSPSLPPLNQQAAPSRIAQLAPNVTTISSHRPSLSPIARAGQVLQDVVVAPSSPRARSQSLGSPFTSPFKSRGGSGTPVGEPSNSRGQSQPINGHRQSNSNLFTNFSDGMRRDLHELSSQGSHVDGDKRPSSSQSVLNRFNDPFKNDSQSPKTLGSSADKGRYTLGLPSNGHITYPKFQSSQISKEANDNWKPRQTSIPEDVFLAVSHPTVDHNVRMIDAPETLAERLEREWACERKVVSQQIDAASMSQVIRLSSEDDDNLERSDTQGEEEDGDVDIWQDEARNSSSIIEDENGKQSSSAPKQPSKKTIADKPRRSKIPSPWRKNSRRLVYSDELAEMSSPADHCGEVLNPEKLEKQTEMSHSNKGPTVVQESSFLNQDSQEFTGIWQMQIPQIPQKANFNPRPQTTMSQLDFSAFFGPSPRKSLPTPVTSEPVGPSHRKESRHSSPLVTAVINRLNVSPPKTLQSSPFVNADTADYEQDGYLSPHNENFGSDADWPDDMSTPARSAVTSKGKTTTKKTVSPIRSVVQKSMTSNSQFPESTSQSQTEATRESTQLSTTEWSKPHWKILNKILQQAKPLEAKDVYSLGDMFVKEEYFVGLEVERNEEGFVTSQILGKEVYLGDASVGDERMLLDQWHLEIIAIFREVVGFDDEKALAKRLFGLIAAEERRIRKAKVEAESRGKGKAKAVV